MGWLFWMALGWAQQGSAPAADPLPPEGPAPAERPDGGTAPEAGATPTPVPPPTAEQARQRLQEAVQHYLDGDATGARQMLSVLLGFGPDLEVNVRKEALVWLADILYSEEGEKAARNALEALLSEDPDYTLDSFAHPPELSRFFEQMKAERAAVANPPPPPPPAPKLRPFPLLVFLPGGVYYYVNGQPWVGVTLSTLQVASVAGSAALFVQLSELPAEVEPTDEDQVSKARGLRALNWSIATAGWLSLAVPILVETGRWGTERARVSVGTDGKQILVAGRF
jgi:hypothetical protein